jgi:hypothetical protein
MGVELTGLTVDRQHGLEDAVTAQHAEIVDAQQG